MRLFDIKLVILAGFTKIVPSILFDEFHTVNIHPSLLPRHKGLLDIEVHKSVIKSGDLFSGCTLHEVTNNVDGGWILLQKQLRVSTNNQYTLKSEIQKLEKRYSLGGLNFDAVVIADFDESLKSVSTSLLYTDVLPKNKYFITLNQWFDESLLNETDIQPLYYPSINKENFDNYKIKYFNAFNEDPTHLSLLSYDLVGLVYYLTINSNLKNLNKIFKKKNSFKGKIGIFDIKDNKINHRLNFYKIENQELIEIF